MESLPSRPCVLLKDFVQDEYQLVEARVAGADCALLIVAILPPARLHSLMAVSRELGMEPLVEVANAREMALALDAGARLVGVNNRDLHTFTVDADTTGRLASMLLRTEQSSPEDFKILLCALSGIQTRADVERYAAAGCEAVLVGEALMRAAQPAAAVRELLGLPASPSLQPTAAAAPVTASASSSVASPGSAASVGSYSSLLAPTAVLSHARRRSGSLTSLRPVVITPPPVSPSPLPPQSPSTSPLPLPIHNPLFAPVSALSVLSHSAAQQQQSITLPPAAASSDAQQQQQPHRVLVKVSGACNLRLEPTSACPPPPAASRCLPLPAVCSLCCLCGCVWLAQVCGLVSVQSALLAYEAGADLLGLIFAPGSKRQLKIETAASIVAAVRAEARSRLTAADQHDALNGGGSGSGSAGLPASLSAEDGWLSSQARGLLQLVRQRRSASALPLFVGVFVDASVEEMNATALQLGLDLVQLHGSAEPATLSRLCRPAVRVVPVIPMLTTADDCIRACEKHGQLPGRHAQPEAAARLSCADRLPLCCRCCCQAVRVTCCWTRSWALLVPAAGRAPRSTGGSPAPWPRASPSGWRAG